MRRRRQLVVALCGLVVVAVGAVLGFYGAEESGGAGGLVVLIALVAFGLGVWKIRGTPGTSGGDRDAPTVPWAPDEPFANPAPERTDRDPALSSDALAGVIEAAGEEARDAGTVADGLAVVRPPLREALLDALERGGWSRSDAEAALADGSWTDDRVAASVLAAAVDPPTRPLRERVRAWLYPERVVRRRARRATGAVAEVADDALPTVPGQTAPRSVPVLQPRLEDLQRGADGRLQRAVEPRATARGPGPTRPRVEDDAERTDAQPEGDERSETGPRAAERSDDDRPADERSASRDGTIGRQVRWRGAIAATVALAVAGVADGNPVLLFGAVIPLVFVAAGSLSRVRLPDGLVATRTVSPTPAPPGQPVTVALDVTNRSDRTITDLRIADGVPADLAVLEGSPRAGATLRPGERVRVEYLVVARRGEYAFESPQCRVRGLGATAVATTALPVAGDRSVVCRLDADAPPIAEDGTGRVGQLTTDDPGEGTSFHSTREYHPDDPADRIDWRHYAKRGTLATVNYERQVSATVVLVIDARAPNRVVAGRGQPTAVEYGTYAATRALSDLLKRGHDVGVAVLGLDGPGPAGCHWLEPASGPEQRTRALDLLRSVTDGQSATGSDSGPYRSDVRRRGRTSEQVRKVLELAPASAQLALFSPVLDDPPVGAVETWRGAGLPVVVCSPDVVPENTVSGQYEQTRRRTRLARCQAAGARTVDWRRGTPLPLVIEHAFAADARLSSSRLTGGGSSGGGSRDGASGAEAAADDRVETGGVE
ncbi:DUF58 domain-containing protein [Natrinema salaciae]|uniref:Conserved repeat domain-containing protein n=1 Tax=Natrinema salaciae TaxID=1186196 RepID=A0A1H9MXG1_9EURY|nr:DUF58 domain-containing protein [Natrinema salaciae]SER28400.1 conserved repeat domain-containing protein [Natrinema salaciae]